MHKTFKNACVALRLCEDDTQWKDCLDEARHYARPRHIRHLFCQILVNCFPSKPEELYHEYKDCMLDDFRYRRRDDVLTQGDAMDRLVENDLLTTLNNCFEDHGYINSDFGLDMPDVTLERTVADTSTEWDPDAERFFQDNLSRLNKGQRCVYDKVASLLDAEVGSCMNVDAPGGTGKTFLAEVILARVRKNRDIAVACAMSGIAATLLSLGTTTHKRFGVPVPCTEESSSKHKLNSNESKLIKMAKVLIIDEVSMMDYKVLDLIDRYLRELMGNDEPFGGKLILLMHDFRQILPVIPRGNRAAVVSASVKYSDNWENFTACSLSENMRVGRILMNERNPTEDRVKRLQDHACWLLKVGDGDVPPAIEHTNIIEVPAQMVCESKEDLETKVYGDFEANYDNETYLSERAIMSSTNDVIQACNFEMVKRIPTGDKPVFFLSRDICQDPDDQARFDSDCLNQIETSGLPPHRLFLKVGAIIILIKNLSVRMKHVNGGRYIITRLTDNLIFARKLDREGGGDDEVLIPRIPTISKDSDGSFVTFKRTPFPVLLAYYLTLNRAQGQTLKTAGMYLPTSVFSHGHLYVGYSRCGDPDRFFVYAGQEEFENLEHLLDKSKTYTRNVVYKEIFES